MLSMCIRYQAWGSKTPGPYPPPPPTLSYLPPYPFQEHPFYLPIILYLYTSSTNSLSHPNVPIHIVYWACPPTPHFRFFGVFFAIYLLSSLSPTFLYPLLLFIKALHSH